MDSFFAEACSKIRSNCLKCNEEMLCENFSQLWEFVWFFGLDANGNIELSTLLKYTVVESECEKASYNK